jgi:hypothetical protein
MRFPIMKFLIKAAVIAAALGASAAASATTYDFSYTFSDGQQITGSLNGTLSGTNITNISDVQVSFNGIAFAGGTDANGPTTLQMFGGYDASDNLYDVPAVFSTVSSQNNFMIADENPDGPNQANYYFTFVNSPAFGTEIGAANFLQSDSFSGPGGTQADADFADDGTWKVTAAPVPVPAALPLLASGLALFGIGRRRRAA